MQQCVLQSLRFFARCDDLLIPFNGCTPVDRDRPATDSKPHRQECLCHKIQPTAEHTGT